MASSLGKSAWACLGLSVLVHAGGVVGLSRLEVPAPARAEREALLVFGAGPRFESFAPLPRAAQLPPEAPLPPPEAEGAEEEIAQEPPEPEPVRLGIAESTAETPNWLGFAEATEHRAQVAEVDQSALTREPGAAAPSGVASSASAGSTAAATASAPVAPQPAQAASASAEAGAAGAAGEVLPRVEVERPEPAAKESEFAEKAASPEQKEAEDSTAKEERDGPQKEVQAEEAPGEQGSAEASPPAEAKQAVAPVPPVEAAVSTEAAGMPVMEPASESATERSDADRGGQASAEGAEGARDDRESDAASRTEIVDRRRLGQVIAARGLQLRTVRPQWGLTTLATASPRNPTLVIHFNRAGRVTRAGFIRGQGTGYVAVDEPLLNAVYQWTATGEELLRLPEGDTTATVTIELRIMLRASG